MSRISDLEKAIRESYGLVREYQDVIRFSNDPREKKRAEREIEEQWDLIGGYLEAYEPLCTRVGHKMPDDVSEIIFVVKRTAQKTQDKALPQAVEKAVPGPKYQIHIERADHVAIGDGAQSTHQEGRASGVGQTGNGNASVDRQHRIGDSTPPVPPAQASVSTENNRPERNDRPNEYTYDAFISFSDNDVGWVEGQLLPRLERAGIRYIDQLLL